MTVQQEHAQLSSVWLMFEILKFIGADSVYDNAIELIEKHGYSNHLTYDPYTNEIDVWGAILIACGANVKLLKKGNTEPEDCGVPPYMCGRARFMCQYLEYLVNKEISAWCQENNRTEAISLLIRAGDRVAITVLHP